MSLHARIVAFLRDRSLAAANGQPLYAYRCNDAEFAQLGVELAAELGNGSRWSDPSPATAQAFCLWGAEWWRRNHAGGKWAWEEMLAAIGCDDHAPGGPYYLRLQRIVAEGMRQWKRPLLRIGSGRAFLVTLACEGGLPLKLVRNETAALRLYFKALLEEVRIFGRAGVPARDLAERLAFRLPKSLRHDVVYELCGKLAGTIWELQREVSGSVTPVADLDRRRPEWRDELPLAIDDNVARALLNNLLLDAADVARGRSGRIRWIRAVSSTAKGFRLIGLLGLPGSLRTDDLWALWPDLSDPPRRFELCIAAEGVSETVAYATRSSGSPGANDAGHYTIEPIRDGLAAASGHAAAGSRTLVIRAAGQTHATDAFAGAAALSDLPWVFEDTGDSDAEWRFIGEGSASVRADAAIIACQPGTTMNPLDGSTVEELGLLEDFGRRLVRVRGAVRIRDVEGNLAIVRTRADGASEGIEYRLQGRAMIFGRDGAAVYIGAPSLVAFRPDGLAERIRSEDLQWRSGRSGAGWEPFSSRCIGAGTLRYVSDGGTRFSQRICVLPHETKVTFAPDPGGRGGAIELDGLGRVELAVLNLDGITARPERIAPGVVRLHLVPIGKAPSDVQLLIRWPDRGEARLWVPFPAQDTRFESASGHPLPPDAPVAVDRLARVRAVAIVPARVASFFIEGGYRGGDASTARGRNRLIRHEVPEIAPGLFELALGPLQRTVESRLAFSEDPQGHVRLWIRSNDVVGLPNTSLCIYRFDFELTADWDVSQIQLPPEALAKLSEEEILGLRLEAVSLFAPQDPPVPLPRESNVAWHFPQDNLSPGPWLVLARQGDWCRARPLWRFVRPVPGSAADPHPFLQLFQNRGTGEEDRRRVAADLVRRIRTDVSDPAWDLVDGQLDLTSEIPAVTFDLLVELARDPFAAAFAAFRAPSDAAFSRLWRALETLPFWWRAVGSSTWEEAADAYAESLERSLESVRDAFGAEFVAQHVQQQFDSAAARIAGELGSVLPVIDRVAARRFGRKPDPQRTALLRADLRQHLMLRRQSLIAEAGDQLGPDSWNLGVDCVGELVDQLSDIPWARDLWIQRAGRSVDERVFEVLNAPVVAALCSVADRELSPDAVYQLRTAFELAPAWFGDLYDLTYWYALGIEAESRIAHQLNSD